MPTEIWECADRLVDEFNRGHCGCHDDPELCGYHWLRAFDSRFRRSLVAWLIAAGSIDVSMAGLDYAENYAKSPQRECV